MPTEQKRRPLSWVLSRPKSPNVMRPQSSSRKASKPDVLTHSQSRPATSSYKSTTSVPLPVPFMPTIKRVYPDFDPGDASPAVTSSPVVSSPRATADQRQTEIQTQTQTMTQTSHGAPVDKVPRPDSITTDQGRFLQRLQTFDRTFRWSAKLPDVVNEVQWAKRGWSCTDDMTCKCLDGCGQDVIVEAPPDYGGEYYAEENGADGNMHGHVTDDENTVRRRVSRKREVRETILKQLQTLMIEGHEMQCPWREQSCQDTIQCLPLEQPGVAMADMRRRCQALLRLGPMLPPQRVIKGPEDLNVSKLIRMLPPDFLTPGISTDKSRNTSRSQPVPTDAITQDNKLSAFKLALGGWDGALDPELGVATCGACFRRLALWIYGNPKPDGTPSVYHRLDPVAEHMHYCPWSNARVQCADKKSLLAADKPQYLAPQSGSVTLTQIMRSVPEPVPPHNSLPAMHLLQWDNQSRPNSLYSNNTSSVATRSDLSVEIKKQKRREPGKWSKRIKSKVRQALSSTSRSAKKRGSMP